MAAQMTMEMARMMVPAFLMYIQLRSHMCWTTLKTVGMR